MSLSEPKWSEGPWERVTVTDEQCHGWFVRPCKDRIISVEGRTEEEAEANANLIVATPKLYEALERILGDITGEGEYVGPRPDYAYAALAEARGEQP